MNKSNNKKKSNNIEHYSAARSSGRGRGIGNKNYNNRPRRKTTSTDIMMLICSCFIMCFCFSLIPIGGLIMYLYEDNASKVKEST